MASTVLDATQVQTLGNILDNGGFEIWQRGTTFSALASGLYCADRWIVGANETANVTISKETATIDSVGLASMKVVVTSSGAGKSWRVQQFVENFADYRGKTVTLSARVKASVASTVKVSVYDGFAQTDSAYHSGGGSFETLSVTVPLNAATSQLLLLVGMVNGGDKKDGTYYFDNAMLAVGTTASFVPTNIQADLARCQRFFCRFGGNIAFEIIPGSTQAISTGACYLNGVFPVLMRAAPTITINNQTHFVVWASGATQITTVTISPQTISPQTFELGIGVASGIVAGNASQLFANNSDATIFCSADL